MAHSSQRKRWVDCAVSTWGSGSPQSVQTWSCAPADGCDRIEWKKMVPPAAGSWPSRKFRTKSTNVPDN